MKHLLICILIFCCKAGFAQSPVYNTTGPRLLRSAIKSTQTELSSLSTLSEAPRITLPDPQKKARRSKRQRPHTITANHLRSLAAYRSANIIYQTGYAPHKNSNDWDGWDAGTGWKVLATIGIVIVFLATVAIGLLIGAIVALLVGGISFSGVRPEGTIAGILVILLGIAGGAISAIHLLKAVWGEKLFKRKHTNI